MRPRLALLAGAVLLAAFSVPIAQRPPRQFQGDNSATVAFVSPYAIQRRCREWGAPAGSVGCSAGHMIWMVNPCMSGGGYADAFCHELGHVNGWPADHSAGRPARGAP